MEEIAVFGQDRKAISKPSQSNKADSEAEQTRPTTIWKQLGGMKAHPWDSFEMRMQAIDLVSFRKGTGCKDQFGKRKGRSFFSERRCLFCIRVTRS